mmetsp:Transcript_13369/g.29024  ORF Transcript_13369/g.29024 Transcript_13369/m.29024 type:complete len:233 (+) Transcript_13369:379-1077(+)
MSMFAAIAFFTIAATLLVRGSAATDRDHRDLRHRQRGHGYDDFFSPCGGFTTGAECGSDATCMWCQKSDDEGICMTSPALGPAASDDEERRLSDWGHGRGRGHGRGGGKCCGIADTGAACRENSITNTANGGQECVWFNTQTTASSSLESIVAPDDRGYCKQVRCEMIGSEGDCTIERGCDYNVDARTCSRFDCRAFSNEDECAAAGGGATCTWYAGDWWRSPRCVRNKRPW